MLFRNLRHAFAAMLDGIWFLVSCTAFVILRTRGSRRGGVGVGDRGPLGRLCRVLLRRLSGRALDISSMVAHHLWPSTRWLTLEGAFFQADQQVQAFGL